MTPTTLTPSTFLGRVLLVDGATCAACAVPMILGASLLAPWLGLSTQLLTIAGAALVPCAAFLFWLGTRERAPRLGVWAVVALNVLWAIDCIALALGAGASPSLLGVAFLAVQAITVLALSGLEVVGLRRLAADVAVA